MPAFDGAHQAGQHHATRLAHTPVGRCRRAFETRSRSLGLGVRAAARCAGSASSTGLLLSPRASTGGFATVAAQMQACGLGAMFVRGAAPSQQRPGASVLAFGEPKNACGHPAPHRPCTTTPHIKKIKFRSSQIIRKTKFRLVTAPTQGLRPRARLRDQT